MSPSDKSTTREKKARQWSSKPLSPSQKSTLARAARTAFDIQREAALVDGSEEDFRHRGVLIACGKPGLRSASNSDFRSILAHFQRLAGKATESKSTWSRTGRVAGSAQIHDTHENRETALVLLSRMIADSGGLISDGYVATVCAGKFQGRTPDALTAADLQELFSTIRNRLDAKRRAAT